MVAVLALAGCSSDVAPASTTAVAFDSTTSSVVTTSTTVVAPTTTTEAVVAPSSSSAVDGPVVLSDPLSIDYPEDPQTVEDLPQVLQDLIGAPMPEPNLLLESEEDFPRWLDEWIGWYTWLIANPTDDPDVLAVGFVPGTDEFEGQVEIARTQSEKGRRSVGWWLVVEDIESLPRSAAMFDQRVAGAILFRGYVDYPMFAIASDGAVLDARMIQMRATVELGVSNGQEEGWRVVSITSVPLS